VDIETRRSFEESVLPHLDAAYNLARHLTSNPDDAADVLQEAIIRAFRFYSRFRGGNTRAWFLTIVHNTACSWMSRHRRLAFHGTTEDAQVERPLAAFDAVPWEPHPDDPETQFLLAEAERTLSQIVEGLSPEFREVFILREVAEFSYAEIAQVANVPIGTVMSRLARARRQVQKHWRRRLALEECL
jgi:RNA polymerase sigma factor (sigma-70 family)